MFEASYQEGRIHNDENKHSLAVKALRAGLGKAKQNATEAALVDTCRRLGREPVRARQAWRARAALEEYMKNAPANAVGRPEVERLLRELGACASCRSTLPVGSIPLTMIFDAPNELVG